MDIGIDPKLVEFVQKKVRSGQYQSVREVVEGALKMMRDIEDLPHEFDTDELRRDIQEGIDQLDRGEGQEWNLAKAQARFLERMGHTSR